MNQVWGASVLTFDRTGKYELVRGIAKHDTCFDWMFSSHLDWLVIYLGERNSACVRKGLV